MESSLSPAAASFHFGRSGSLVDYMSSSEFIGLGNATAHSTGISPHHSPHAALSSSSLKDSSFQLSSYRGPLYAVNLRLAVQRSFMYWKVMGNHKYRLKLEIW